MADTIGIILKYLHQHHFTRAEEVLREEVSLRQQSNGPDLVPLNDDLDLEVAMCLKSVQEKTTQKHAELKAVPNKPAQDKLVTDVKPSAALRLAAKEEPHGHVEPLWSSMKAEVSEPLFMEFEVKDFERSTKLHSTLDVGSSPSQVSLSPISQKKMIERRKSPGRIGGLSVLQTEAEMGAISSIEKVTPDLKEAEASNASPGNVASDSCIGGVFTPTSQRKELLPGHEADPPQAHFEATRGKVDALKQRWEPKAADKPALEREKSFRAVVAMAKKVESQSDKWTESNGQSTDVQDSATFLPEATIEVQLAPRNEIKANATLPTDSKSEDVSAGSLNFTVPKSPEWAEVPIKTIPLIKTSVSLAADSKKSFEEGGKETISINPPHLYPERLQTGTKQELVPQAFGKQDTGSQYAAVSSDELKTSYTIEQSTVEGPSSTIVERKLTCVAPRSVQEGLPKLAPVRLRSIDAKSLEAVQDEYASGMKKSVESSSPGNVAGTANAIPFGLGSYLDVPVGQDVSSSGSRRIPASARPSVSHGIVEDQSELLSGFATAGDVQSESAVEYADECWDSDTYEDDDDPGYLRQPIEDEEWFLAHEIDYPSDDERARPNEEAARSSRREKDYEKYEKDEEEGCSVLEEEQSYFSGEESLACLNKAEREKGKTLVEVNEVQTSEVFGRMDGGDTVGINRQIADATRILDPDQFDRQLLGAVNVPLMDSDTRWRNFDASKGIQSEEEGVKKPDHGRAVLNNHVFVVEDDRMGSVRFGGVGVSSDVADFGSERRQSVPGESGEGDLDIGEIGDRSMGQTRLSPQLRNSARGKAHESESNRKQDEEEEEEDLILKYYNNPWASHKRRGVEREVSTLDILHLPNSEKENSTMEKVSNVGEGRRHKESETAGTTGFGGFSFPSPSTSGGDIGAVSRVDSGKSLWSVRDITGQMLGEEADYGNGVSEPDDPLASWRRKSNESSPMLSPRNDGHRDLSVRSTGSASSTAGYGSTVAKDENAGEGDDEVEQDVEEEDTLEVHQKIRDTEAVAAEDEEAAAVQEQIRRIRAEEEEFETFDLKIIHRKNRTGFEEDKDFPVVINAVVAGRYHVTEYLGSAAFSTAIQAHDLLTGMDVCMKIIKNNKDFFDQSLDEIKLLKYINKHDPGDKHHLLRLYDYFYHREHLFIVCELLRANLYEFHKYNRESGGEVYFTMPRLQSIARQCLEALEFIHSLGLIHCDLKPENILVKSYSRCEIKVIDLGSSCFQTDHLCPYVQSRSYRAPEVILGLPYDHKIDMWSLGCILAELCSGNVLFQNDSLATLLARVVGILGPIEPELLSKGRDTHKFFTKNHTLYERNQDSDQLEYLLPKKTSLAHRLPMGDQGFVEFVGYLLNINPLLRPNASEALKHPWLLFPYEPISS
ncbi:uncharacterized protein [Physcomitrium patens]|uniref:uncharacterized protein isoform X1 n=1 Tax=Physcomitrium patens TaxID=3218 RepID=UPI000D157237|nr:uncharacterized protein LOC112280431 isoform X1 [Physcomitrium patens]XP_024371683.1 uncharacterized protein LOC112280431 isoform X1 [Physcomitrium patens]XP_024371685.1 uncharacterized protein LOC112280431 isoform X1 [Physcomitrium patens]|eukprot:XP_024371682.1 uncharacterized protein LOC112280431 isoform X1 [Physcomitrella patens]